MDIRDDIRMHINQQWCIFQASIGNILQIELLINFEKHHSCLIAKWVQIFLIILIIDNVLMNLQTSIVIINHFITVLIGFLWQNVTL